MGMIVENEKYYYLHRFGNSLILCDNFDGILMSPGEIEVGRERESSGQKLSSEVVL
jgi:hypothetical protein